MSRKRVVPKKKNTTKPADANHQQLESTSPADINNKQQQRQPAAHMTLNYSNRRSLAMRACVGLQLSRVYGDMMIKSFDINFNFKSMMIKQDNSND